MKRLIVAVFAVAVLALALAPGISQPAGDKEKGPKKGKKGPPPFELGKVLPPYVREELELSEDQQSKVADLEKEVRTKLLKILTGEQVERVRELKGPKGPPREQGGPPKEKDPPTVDQQSKAGGIQWFATWNAGLAEAHRTGKPILLVSAAPHCAGVSGIW